MTLPVMLNSSLRETRRLHPLKMSADFSMRDVHSARITLSEAEEYTRSGPRTDAVTLHSIVLIRLPNGAPYVFRVCGMTRNVRGEIELELKHLIDTLNDDVWRAKYSSRGYVSQFMSDLLGYQTHAYWTMGGSSLSAQAKWYRDECDYTKLGDLFGELRDAFSRHYVYYSHDMYGGQVVSNDIYIADLPAAPGAEFRLGRNVEKCRIERDDSEMCNHLFIKWHATGGSYYYVRDFTDAASVARYGEIQKSEELSTDDIDSTDYATYAANYLLMYAKPKLTVSIDGYELKKLTGQTWDEMSIGKLVRVALPEYGETYEERCVSVSYPDLVGTPEKITVELGDHQETLTEITANTRKKAGGGYKGHYLYQSGGEPAEDEEEDS